MDEEKFRKDREKRMYELQMESFVRQWAPDDPYEHAQFDAQLFSLVRQIYCDAQAPVLEQLGKVASYAPLALPK
jgi:hypothetical protein